MAIVPTPASEIKVGDILNFSGNGCEVKEIEIDQIVDGVTLTVFHWSNKEVFASMAFGKDQELPKEVN